ncbi:MAG: cob(I)yrinic acid a,c-diamide adenosyltransferase [Bacteroidota bacterium]
MSFKIYTKTGDKGETGLFGGKRLPKHHIRIETYGTVDELNSFLGLVGDAIRQTGQLDEAVNLMRSIQNNLFTIGSSLATDPEKSAIIPGIDNQDIEALESSIDKMDKVLPPLKNFILPGGHIAVSYTHVARCVCRRAERLSVALDHEESIDPLIIKYLNRLSDYLFTLARMVSQATGAEEIPWIPRK